jgi:phosphoglycerate dehydrogenase-like enzyme
MRSVTRPTVVVLSRPDYPRPAGIEQVEQHAEVRFTDAAGLAGALRGADALFLWDFFSTALREAWPHADALTWVHVAAAGVDTVLFDELAESPVQLTNAHGVFDGPIAEYVLACILARDKALHENRELQRGHVWKHRETRRTAGSTALVIGTGGIGRHTARLLRAAGLEVKGAGRTARTDDPDFGTVVPTAELSQYVGWADNVVTVAPLTDQTRGMINAEVLAAMKPSAHLINVGRGPLVDEQAVLDALHEGRLAAASLDVFSEEPLPADSPFWDAPGVCVSAHMSGDVVGWRDELAAQFCANFDRWRKGDELLNVVDKRRGYVSPQAG